MPDPFGARGALRLLATPDPLPGPLLDAMLDQLPDYHLGRLAARTDLPSTTVDRLMYRAARTQSPTYANVLCERINLASGEDLNAMLHSTAEVASLASSERERIASELTLVTTAQILAGQDVLAAMCLVTYSSRLNEADRTKGVAHALALLDGTTEADWPLGHYDKALALVTERVLANIDKPAMRALVLASTDPAFLSWVFLEGANTGGHRRDREVVEHLARGGFLAGIEAGATDDELIRALDQYVTYIPLDVLDAVAAHPSAGEDVAERARLFAQQIRAQMPRTSPRPERDEQFANRFVEAVESNGCLDAASWTQVLTLLSQLDPQLPSEDAITTVTTVLA